MFDGVLNTSLDLRNWIFLHLPFKFTNYNQNCQTVSPGVIDFSSYIFGAENVQEQVNDFFNSNCS